MTNALKQFVAVSRVAILGLPSRARMSLVSVVSVALVTLVLLGFLSMAAGFRETVAGSGSEESAVVLAEGASSEFNSAIRPQALARLENAPGVARAGGVPLISAESHTVVSVAENDGAESSVTLRGMGPHGLAVRPQATLVEGRMFGPGRNELVVGRAVAGRYRDLKLGRTVRLAGVDWTVVGVFGTHGSAMESEVWADQKLVAQFFQSGDAVQSARLRLTAPDALAGLQAYAVADAGAKLDVKSEKAHYAAQARGTGNLILYVGWPLGIAMAVGALAGALNTMLTSVSTRSDEIVTLRTLGFGSGAMFVSTMVESLLLVVAGALVGVVLAWLFLHGMAASTVGANLTQVMFTVELTGRSVVQAVLLAVVVGVLGGALPSWRAARQSLVRSGAQ